MSSENGLRTIEALLVKGIEYFLTKHSSKVLEDAKEKYLQGTEGNYKEFGFDNWFLCDYLYEGKDMMTYYQQNQTLDHEERLALQSVQASWFSYFEVFEIEGKALLKDLFTKADYKVENSELLADGIIVAARLYPQDGKYYIEILENFNGEMQQHVTGAVLAKYNEYCVQNGNTDVESFLKEESLLLYKFMNVFKNVSFQESDADDEFMVYQSDYVFESRDKVIELLSTEGSFEFLESENDEEIYSFTIEGAIVELVILKNKIEIEAPNESARQVVKDKVETLLNGYITFVQDLVLQMDDIL
jgi:hypothetical protein